mgnify:CR=1 FL=1|nr:MAG TPA: hypothetical protein [Caudoviricetes sp.]
MSYAKVTDIEKRCQKTMSDSEKSSCELLLEDAAVIIDAYNKKASEEAKKVVSCNMVIRAVGQCNDSQFPIGATQGTVSALGYSQSFTMGNGSVGELYLAKLDKKLLGVGNKLSFASPWNEEAAE